MSEMGRGLGNLLYRLKRIPFRTKENALKTIATLRFDDEAGVRAILASTDTDERDMIGKSRSDVSTALQLIHAKVWKYIESQIPAGYAEKIKPSIKKAVLQSAWPLNWSTFANFNKDPELGEYYRAFMCQVRSLDDKVTDELLPGSEALRARGISSELQALVGESLEIENKEYKPREHQISLDIFNAKRNIAGKDIKEMRAGVEALFDQLGLKVAGDVTEITMTSHLDTTGYSLIFPLTNGQLTLIETWPDQGGLKVFLDLYEVSDKENGASGMSEIERVTMVECRALAAGIIALLQDEERPNETKVYVEESGPGANASAVDLNGAERLSGLPPTKIGGHRVEGIISNAATELLLYSEENVKKCKEAILEILKEEDLTIEGTPIVVKDTEEAGGGYSIHIALTDSFVVVGTWPRQNEVDVFVDLCHPNRENTSRTRRAFAKIAKLFAAMKGSRISVKEGRHGP